MIKIYNNESMFTQAMNYFFSYLGNWWNKKPIYNKDEQKLYERLCKLTN